MEEWRDINGYEGLYQVSSEGRVRSIDRYVMRNGSPAFLKGKILKQNKCGGRNSDYWFVGLSKDNKVKQIYVHTLVAFAFPEICGEYFEGAQVNHKDENKNNNTPSNLEWCTPRQNLMHNDRHIKVGIKERGKKSQFRKKVKIIKNGEWFATYFTPQDAASLIGVNESVVRQNIYGVTKKVKDEFTFEYLDGSGRLSDEKIKAIKDRRNYLRRQRR